jgi:hypothetical protein
MTKNALKHLVTALLFVDLTSIATLGLLRSRTGITWSKNYTAGGKANLLAVPKARG